jgi:NAD(P)-dependent dehydrogenase (short-subunit alcohol dehydrogenase family)
LTLELEKMFGKYATLTDPVHNNSYPAISPLRPELSQVGKTILISGGTTGIGYGIARGFVRASAAKVIITGRRADVVSKATQDLIQESAHTTEVIGFPCDISDAAAVEELWLKLKSEGTIVDVLVLNAVMVPPKKPLREVGTDVIWKLFDANVRALLQMTEKFDKQEGKGASATKASTKSLTRLSSEIYLIINSSKHQQYLVYVSSVSVHDFTIGDEYLGYGLTKHSAQLGLQLMAQQNPPEKMQIVSYHPGAIFTESAIKQGWTEDSIPWDHGKR